MTSLKVGDLVELRAGTGTVGTVLDVVESHPRWLLVDWHTPPNTCINLLLENEEFLTLATGDAREHQRRGRTMAAKTDALFVPSGPATRAEIREERTP